ncbi:hypothetical protein STXM2123_3324 [Streptomyces sp. F-3]|nr:hypothetical protein STXM2123_3324 [Streptomyces sp. F-3]
MQYPAAPQPVGLFADGPYSRRSERGRELPESLRGHLRHPRK